jgi:uncharacterized membrane protein YobD (UPF0266 family)
LVKTVFLSTFFSTFVARFDTFQTAFSKAISPLLLIQNIPAESYPLYSKFLSPSIKKGTVLFFPLYAKIPHISSIFQQIKKHIINKNYMFFSIFFNALKVKVSISLLFCKSASWITFSPFIFRKIRLFASVKSIS